ncbi:hypothetical protein TS65_00765 [Aneurinibacillus migulanus]|nr:hypothetical protein TS65_00765 [Aneurinibacillus migulanus]GED14792.1 hypothetical protein AMI01nite_27830 [Aneurinibacillus migulanus]SDJ79506.1 Abortive infection bacteriophage resistance protein [Aneurinibacillus migulanus]
MKPALTHEEQLNLLKNRNLIIKNEYFALEILKRVNYYRLRGYTLSLEKNDRFFDGITFEHVYTLYQFDQKLRNILLPMLENIEIAFRTEIAYVLAHKYGPLGYKNKEYFKSELHHANFLLEVKKETSRGKELFVQHYQQKYDGQFPIWAVVELITFGALSMLFKNMKKDDQKKIAGETYGTTPFYIESWLRTLAYVRNVCAHYGRLYGKRLVLSPKLFDDDKKRGIQEKSPFAAIYIMSRLCLDKSVWDFFISNLYALVSQYEDQIKLHLIGFPENWYELLNEKR